MAAAGTGDGEAVSEPEGGGEDLLDGDAVPGPYRGEQDRLERVFLWDFRV